MNPRIKQVKAEDNYCLRLTFENGETRMFDMKPYLSKGIFRKLRKQDAFRSVKVSFGSIQWKDGQDLCPDTLYEESKPFSRIESVLAIHEKSAEYKSRMKKSRLSASGK